VFQTPVDIANRALQHCGAARIDPTLGFTENSVNAAECGFAYDKLRTAELQRNFWRFATKFAVLRPVQQDQTQLPTMLLQPVLYSSAVSYAYGAIVTDTLGTIWESQIPNNLGYAPGNSSAWELYYGPLAVSAYDTSGTTAYFAGEVVYTTPGDGSYRVFRSLAQSNTDVPGTVAAWSSTVYYPKGATVSYSGTNYQSLIDFNLNQTPNNSSAPWSSSTTYAAGASATGSNGYVYTSIGSGNLNNDPVMTTGYWTNTGVLDSWIVYTGSVSAVNWLDIGATLAELRLINPTGTYGNTAPRNLFRLPCNYLRTPSQDPRAGSVSYLGAPTGLNYNDWTYDGDYISTRDSYPIVFRFIADVSNVAEFDDMFCEGLALRLAYEICPRVTQAPGKQQEIAKAYNKFMSEARIVDSIETGAVEPAEDDWISCRA
jgi:hypothetical protein